MIYHMMPAIRRVKASNALQQAHQGAQHKVFIMAHSHLCYTPGSGGAESLDIWKRLWEKKDHLFMEFVDD